METAIDSSANLDTSAKPNILRWFLARRRVSVLLALVLIAIAVHFALRPRGPSAYERWFATLAHNESPVSPDLGDVPQAQPEPQEEIDIYAIGRVRGEAINWQLHYLPDTKDQRALRILELAREADAFPSSKQFSADEVSPDRVKIGNDDSITLIVSTKDGGFRGEFGPNELAKNVKLATMLRLFENFALQDTPKDRY